MHFIDMLSGAIILPAMSVETLGVSIHLLFSFLKILANSFRLFRILLDMEQQF